MRSQGKWWRGSREREKIRKGRVGELKGIKWRIRRDGIIRGGEVVGM